MCRASESAVVPADHERDFMPDIEILTPHHHCPSRRATLLSATFNLVASIVGGGILSVPLAFQKCGLVVSTLLMILAAASSDFSLYILCSCARRTGASSYGEVCRVSYGPGLEVFTTILLFVFLFFVIIAYMVLVQDIWTPIFTLAIQTISGQNSLSDGSDSDNSDGNAVLLGVVLLMSPFLLKRDLHALRFNCYVGFASAAILCFAIARRVSEKYQNGDSEAREIPSVALFPKSFADVLFAFPIITLAFLSQFNILSIQRSLISPCRKRVRLVIDVAVALCFILTYAFGLLGYLYGGEDTRGNILLNFSFDDKVVLLGRVGYGITIMFALPIVTLPCRESLLAIGPQFVAWREGDRKNDTLKDDTLTREYSNSSFGSSEDDEMASLEDSRLKQAMAQEVQESNQTEVSPLLVSDVAQISDQPLILSDKQEVPGCESQENVSETIGDHFVHIVSTFLIVSICYVAAVSASGVAVVWSICGSSMAFLIAYILPGMCYIKIRAWRKGHSHRMIISSWIMLVISIVAAIACTTQTVWRMFFVGYGQ